jgi:putative addiction module killer protein
MSELRYYLNAEGGCPFEDWFAGLDSQAAAKVTTAIVRVQEGNLSQLKAVGEGVSEIKIDWGPGYRVYFGRDGNTVVILLKGGSKKRQDDDIKAAKLIWKDYKRRRKVQE